MTVNSKFVLMFIMAIAALSVLPKKIWAADTGEFLQKATVSNIFEIESSKLAVERAQRQDVKDFAQMMIADHTKAGAEMKAALPKTDMKIAPPEILDEAHQEKMKELRNAETDEFDERYIDMQVEAHEDAVSLFGDYAEDGDMPELRQFASTTLPTLQHHERMIKEIDKAE